MKEDRKLIIFLGSWNVRVLVSAVETQYRLMMILLATDRVQKYLWSGIQTRPHICPESEYFFAKQLRLKCNYCKAPITFHDDYISPYTSKKIPLDPETERPHNCPQRRRATSKTRCTNCGERIYFHPDYIICLVENLFLCL